MKTIRFIAAFALLTCLLVPGTAQAATGTPTLSLEVSKKLVPYQGQVTVTAKLAGADGTATPVSIFASQFGRQAKMIKSTVPSATGVASTTIKVATKTTFYALFEGDETYSYVRSNAQTVKAKARIVGDMAGNSSKDGKYFIYHAELPILRVKVAPNHMGDLISFVAQVPEGKGWGTFDTATALLEADSTANCFLAMPPGNYRMKAVFKGDDANTGASTKWFYIRLLQA